MKIPPSPPADSIPTEQEEFVAYLVNFFRHSAAAARRAVEAHEEEKK